MHYFTTFRQKTNNKTSTLRFFKCRFRAQNMLIPPFLILRPSIHFLYCCFLLHLISISSTSYSFYTTSFKFHHLPLILITFYQFLPTFIRLLLTFNSFLTPSTFFYYLPPFFTKFYTTSFNFLSPLINFILPSINQKMVQLFFLFSRIHQSHHIVRCYVTGINFLLFSFWHGLHCLYLLQQMISVTWIIVSGSSPSKLSSSRLPLLRSTLAGPASSLKNLTLWKSALTKTISLLKKIHHYQDF